ncbi:SLAC1 anion channel family protein [Thioclava sp. FTW29]|uniref:SLAC1 anion channel family protein n=1 Tax=Thioclava litoralis TaxID=3076557 RepID=A0ABZ1E554_9RHOB|nr:SLAC1 anion channel family protein [Thioclava sp. FTW29]
MRPDHPVRFAAPSPASSLGAAQTPSAGPAALPPESSGWLAHFPVSLFGMTMGLMGYALALRSAGAMMASHMVFGLACAVFGLLATLFVAKALRQPQALKAEWNHPVRLAFFPAIAISGLLLARLVLEYAPSLANILWMLGAAAQFGLTLVIISAWISARPFGPESLSPAWFIPAVGNLVVPLAGVPLGHIEASWYFFAAGLTFWIILTTLVINRLIFHAPLPGKLRPTLVILIAPPAMAFLSWLLLTGPNPDALARILLNVAYLFAALVLFQLPGLLRLPFSISFWALSFPLAALTTASFRFAAMTGSVFHQSLGHAGLALLSLTVILLLWNTLRLALRGQICLPE